MKSKGKYVPMLLLALLLCLVWQQQWWKGPHKKPRVTVHNNTGVTNTKNENTTTVHTPAGLNRHAILKYTRHARCRMECRHVSEQEVEEILATGRVNTGKSDPYDQPCPTYALEGYSDEGQHLRVVFAPCEDTTSVITCIDLDKDWTCSCN